MTARKTPAKPQDGTTRATAIGTRPAKLGPTPTFAHVQSKTPAKPLRPTPDVPLAEMYRIEAVPSVSPLTMADVLDAVERWHASDYIHPPAPAPLTFADIKAWHLLTHAPAPEPTWDATWLIVALMLLACLALGGVVEAFAHAHGVLGL